MAYYFFTETNALNGQMENAFGPTVEIIENGITYEQFLLTSKHLGSTDPNAIAVCNGQIFVQEQSNNPSLLNIALKPTETQLFNFPKIKYFIYRGIKKDSLISSDNLTIAAKGTNTLVDSIWHAFDKFNNTGSPSKEIIGLNSAINLLASSEILDDIFLKTFSGLQFWSVKGGDVIGKFDKNAIGFEIVQEDLFYKPNLGFIRKNETICKVKALVGTPTDVEFFDHWHDKEQILSFIDPCCFFASFYNTNLCLKNGTSETKVKSEALFEDLISKFLNKDQCYIDIRNEFNFSLNYFKNYSTTPATNTAIIKIKFGSDSFQDKNYYAIAWPILVIKSNDFPSETNNVRIVTIKLPSGNGDNLSPILYADKAYNYSNDLLVDLVNGKQFKTLSVASNYTDAFEFAIPFHEHIISSYTLLKYGKRTTEEPIPSALPMQIRKTDYLDCLFPLSINFNYETSKLKTKVYDTEIYLDVSETHHYEGVFSLTIDFDLKNITLLANPTLIKTKEFKRRPLSLTNSFNASNIIEELNKIELSSNLTKSTLKISGADTDIIRFDTSMADVKGDFNIPDLRNIIGINITKIQWETIIDLANNNFIQKYPTYLAIIDKEYLEDDDGKTYTSLNLAVTGYKLQNDNLLVDTLPANINLITYGIV